MKIATITTVTVAALMFGCAGNTASAEASVFELNIANETGTDLTFRLHDGQSKHARLVHGKSEVSSYTIKAGASDTIGVQPTGNKCSPSCGTCTPTIGKVYAYYNDGNGNEQRNNYYEPSVEFFEYCGVAANKPLTVYTSNWVFDHGTGKGTGKFDHSQKSSHNSYSNSSPSKGLTVDGKHISGSATITYSD
jgi:hypothetical protein